MRKRLILGFLTLFMGFNFINAHDVELSKKLVVDSIIKVDESLKNEVRACSLMSFSNDFTNAQTEAEREKMLSSLDYNAKEIIVASLLKRLIRGEIESWKVFVLTVCYVIKNTQGLEEFHSTLLQNINASNPRDLEKFLNKVPDTLKDKIEKLMAKESKFKIFLTLKKAMKK
jgi:hypothetical protein